MAHEIKIPSVGESITSATLGTWHKNDGDYVNSGEVILTIETDKISTELETDKSGILRHSAAEGEELDIGAVVASIEEGKVPSGADGMPSKESAPAKKVMDPVLKAGTDSNDGLKVTPIARKIASEEGIDLTAVLGSGIGGKITKADVVQVASKPASVGPPSAAPISLEGQALNKREGEARKSRKKMTPLRRKIANHLVNAQQEAAILSTFNEVDMTAIMELRKRVQEDFVARHGVKLGFMSFFIKAVVDALKEIPSINAQIEGDEIVENHFYDIGVAVGTEKGLMVPVVRDCDEKSFGEIEQAIVDYAAKAREGTINLSDLQGGVFTLTNGGIYGSLLSTPILNPPQSGILGMHSIQQRPVALNGEVVIRPMMYLALSYDHRLVDGKEAVTFLVRVKDCLEHPDRLLVGA